jgi:zinc/manganese transport system permease protein
MFAQEFVRNAFLAGTFVALACGLVGYFVVLRAQVFAGDALTHVAFTGAVAAAAAGVDIRIGLFAATIAVALGIGALGAVDGRSRAGGRRFGALSAHFGALGGSSGADDVTIGIAFAWVLGLGVYFLAVFSSGAGGGNGLLGARTLFGSILGLSAADARLAAIVAAAIVLSLAVIARPLLFASVDAAVAAVRGVPVRALGLIFLALLGATAAEATQAVGALLLLGLLAAPAGAAQRLTPNPYAGLALSGALAVIATWAGLTISYLIPKLPPSSAIIAVASAIYLLAFLCTSSGPYFGTKLGHRPRNRPRWITLHR